MPAVAPLELSPEEQSFFDAGDAIDESPPEQGQPRRRSRRHHRPSWRRRLHKLRGANWLRVTKTALLVIVAVWIGYRLSLLVVDQSLPDPSELLSE